MKKTTLEDKFDSFNTSHTLEIIEQLNDVSSMLNNLNDELYAAKIIKEYYFAMEMKSLYDDHKMYSVIQATAKKDLKYILDPKRKKEIKKQYNGFL